MEITDQGISDCRSGPADERDDHGGRRDGSRRRAATVPLTPQRVRHPEIIRTLHRASHRQRNRVQDPAEMGSADRRRAALPPSAYLFRPCSAHDCVPLAARAAPFGPSCFHVVSFVLPLVVSMPGAGGCAVHGWFLLPRPCGRAPFRALCASSGELGHSTAFVLFRSDSIHVASGVSGRRDGARICEFSVAGSFSTAGVAEREELKETGLGSTARCCGLRRHRQANSVRVCSPTSRRVQPGSCRQCPLIHPLHVVVAVLSRMTPFPATVDTGRTAACNRVNPPGLGASFGPSGRPGCTSQAAFRRAPSRRAASRLRRP